MGRGARHPGALPRAQRAGPADPALHGGALHGSHEPRPTRGFGGRRQARHADRPRHHDKESMTMHGLARAWMAPLFVCTLACLAGTARVWATEDGPAAAPQADESGADSETPPVAEDATTQASDLDRRIAALERRLAELRTELESSRNGGTEGDLEKKIDALSREVERLRLGAAAPVEAGESVGGFGPAASKVYRAGRGVTVGGYGEMLYVDPSGTRDDGEPSGSQATADLLRAVLYFGYKFNDRFIFNSEIEYEHAVAGEDGPGEVAVEFAFVDYRWRPTLGARGGMLLVPVGFINELHEPPIFLGAQRPSVERFIIPTTWRELGAGVYGDIGPVSWKAYVVTSLDAGGFSAANGFRGARQQGAEAVAEDLAFTARVDWVPTQGLLVGVSVFTGDTAQGRPGFDGARLTQYEAHAEWRARGVQIRGLYAQNRLDEAGAVSALVGEAVGSRMTGYYGEAGYNVLATRKGTSQELVPFVRYESFDTQDEVDPAWTTDPSHSPANDRTVRTYGLHYRPIPGVAIKADWQDLGDAADTGVDRFNIALGWLF